MAPHTLVTRPAREFALALQEERDAAVLAALGVAPAVTCSDGRVYANRTVILGDARRYDSTRDRAERWC